MTFTKPHDENRSLTNHSIPCSIGRPKHPKIMATDFDEKEVYIGRRAQELRGLLKIKWPVEHGIVSARFFDSYSERSSAIEHFLHP
jgi:hypothetical protein